MSDSFPLKKLPAALQNPRAEQALTFVRSPLAIAIVASLGVHGLLWFGLPQLTASEPQKNDPQQAVDVIELSPLEQARLPQSPLAEALKPFSKMGQTEKKPTDSSTVPVTPADPTISDAVPYYSVPDIWGSATSTYNNDSLYRDGDQASDRSSSTQTPPTKSTPKAPPAQSADRETAEPQPEPSAPKTAPTKIQPDGSEDSDTVSKQASDLDGSDLEVSRNDAEKELVALREQYAYNPDDPGLSDGVALEAMSKFSEENGIAMADWSKVKEITVSVPESACKIKSDIKEALKKPLSMGAIVQPDGKLAKVVLFGSSGSKGLNQAAIDYLKGQEFPPGDKNSFLRFRVNFDATNADCGAAPDSSAS